MKRIALYPGTFDPVTNGHLDIIFRASSLCDELIIGVAENIGKNPFFEISQRKSLIQDNTKYSQNFFKYVNEAPTVLLIIIVILVVVKPYS